DGRFAQGVASGFPYPTSTILWTRVSDVDKTSRLHVEVASDPGFRKVVASRILTVRAQRDYTARVRVNRLKPGRQYWYRFHTKNRRPAAGPFRPGLPADSRQKVRIAYVTCQSYEAGYFNAHRAIANEPDLDLVLGLGDYIYESHYYDGPPARKDTTG